MPSDKKTASCFAQCFGQFRLKGMKTKTALFPFPKCLICQGTWMQTMIKTVCKHYYHGAPIEFHMPYLLSQVGKKRLSMISNQDCLIENSCCVWMEWSFGSKKTRMKSRQFDNCTSFTASTWRLLLLYRFA